MRRVGTDRAAGILDRIGMTDEMPIENKMVTNFIEQAQSKVEGFNFDIRKNVVEYDDVIAAQRAVIYKDRQAVLAHEDMHERVLQMLESEIKRVTLAHTTANLAEDWDLDGLVKQFDAWRVAIPDDVFPEQINRLKRDTLIHELTEAAERTYAAKEDAVVKAAMEHKAVEPGEFYMRQFERAVVLQVVDTLWQEHLDHLDVLRSGIGLRGIAQRDPLVEFKREGFQAFEQLKQDIEHHVAELMLLAPVQIQVQEPPPEALPQNLRTNADDIARTSGQEKSAGAAPARPKAQPAATSRPASAPNGVPVNRSTAQSKSAVATAKGVSVGRPNGARPANGQAKGVPAGQGRPQQQRAGAATAMASASASSANQKLGRNDPCYCGSGKKYKVCHGR
jgi:preprotein translocase subunit SecA